MEEDTSTSVPAKIRGLDEPLPATLYWDANLVVNFAFEAAPSLCSFPLGCFQGVDECS